MCPESGAEPALETPGERFARWRMSKYLCPVPRRTAEALGSCSPSGPVITPEPVASQPSPERRARNSEHTRGSSELPASGIERREDRPSLAFSESIRTALARQHHDLTNLVVAHPDRTNTRSQWGQLRQELRRIGAAIVQIGGPMERGAGGVVRVDEPTADV